MVLVLLAIVALVLWLWDLREHYVDPEQCDPANPAKKPCTPPVVRPTIDNESWTSKIDAEAPIEADDETYIRVLQAFHDQVYVPKTTKPTDKDVEAFLQGPTASVPGIDPNALRKIIAAGFRVERTVTGAAREAKELQFEPSEALQPSDGVDGVYGHMRQGLYVPADTRKGAELPEGLYEPTVQQVQPRNPGLSTTNSTSWTGTQFYSVCDSGPCTENVL
jgi:hypothetical protein